MVVVSGDEHPAMVHACIELGAFSFVPKSPDVRELTAAIDRKTGHNPAPRWKVVVTADRGEPAMTSPTDHAAADNANGALQAAHRARSIWFRLLMLLITLVVLAGGYLWVTASRP